MIKSFVSKNIVKTMNFAHLLSSLNYSILFWEDTRYQNKILNYKKEQ